MTLMRGLAFSCRWHGVDTGWRLCFDLLPVGPCARVTEAMVFEAADVGWLRGRALELHASEPPLGAVFCMGFACFGAVACCLLWREGRTRP